MSADKHLHNALAGADLGQAYEAAKVEEHLYKWWEAAGYFKPTAANTKAPFVIAIPPPNVTGVLHTGHGLTNTIEDILTRWHRMLGQPTLWVPGTDHAGIATQNVVEKQLAKVGKTRHDLGREDFLDAVWEWKGRSHSTITNQIRRLGSSVDWQRERFTLDEGLSQAVVVAFKRLYDDGLIYRGTRLVNWCPRCLSAISDLEVVYRDEQEQGNLWHIRYKVANDANDTEWRISEGDQSITIATTRPETLLADVAVAVHPEDERYADLVGKFVVLPALGRQIPIIADTYVEREFGTGALKITPGHDPNDYIVGQRHNLPILNAMNLDATINSEGGSYAGLDRFEARKRLVADLTETGNLVETKPHLMKIGRCERCDTIIEPLISTQWFVKTQPLAEPAMAAVREGRTKIVPERFNKIYFHWMENIQDWCISRQLWWGHRIPVWYGPDNQMFVELNAADAMAAATAHYGQVVELRQDEDVLDTWFSSGLWPFSILGWPDVENPDFKQFYPTTLLETGYDILFFWVARMMMLGLYLTGKEPFEWVYLHGLVRDEHGRKMSKSLGNQVDPMDLIEQYGTDALRFTFATSSTPGQDFALQPTRLDSARSFANKIWNATRFVISKLGDLPRTAESKVDAERLNAQAYTVADRWILSRFNRLAGDVERLMNSFNLGEAGRQIQTFFWDEFADWYIETAKIQIDTGDEQQQLRTRETLYSVLEGTLRLLHPFMPFVSEAAWQKLHNSEQTTPTPAALIIAEYPLINAAMLNEQAERDWDLVQNIIRGVRNVRTETGVEAVKWIEALIAAGSATAMLTEQTAIISRLARIAPDKLLISESLSERPEQATTLVFAPAEVVLPLAGMVDLAAERERLNKELERVEADVERRRTKLANENFVAKAKPEVVQKEREALAAQELAATTLRERLASF
ncbi:MAG TPA: valine--tRNA ligase [Herpetosiphon sp.]|uniref:Valine--tRNA ligase n=1 Tax=Herpetosiphon aurantiacus (strain ATCC 23779 / DSM 785 / 114-95) TaxID=316274 RepID=A9B2P2_HERA2|nr:valine--tRNA ligase [Herpetosiphon sp.]ABX05493.1 valyl-tRNA synthetase [Herpetosiphon aurantiacus DSM 785]HBW52875.1 valine--tRNA ligase [Herpetosiphon sp.]